MNTVKCCKAAEQAGVAAKKEKEENRWRSLDTADICGTNTKKLPLLLLSLCVLSTVVGFLPESVGNHLFTDNNNNNIFPTVVSTLSTEIINPDDTHWARVHHVFVWKYS
ncbi:uncharacterized protein TM35_000531240 [Trypanosoma theileri]|uniref:Uncharacterized protein n=1 Tax=Trypanosoma theileri TaxID=67003 RepID=A0A1X0NIK8_9TRYP|nr:uncharacterized protein TM35_000531240 [Trypanosoma theileri]ORC83940.1 hypothetical protein TM35_000531240 [Trypanosoma theileri]